MIEKLRLSALVQSIHRNIGKCRRRHNKQEAQEDRVLPTQDAQKDRVLPLQQPCILFFYIGRPLLHDLDKMLYRITDIGRYVLQTGGVMGESRTLLLHSIDMSYSTITTGRYVVCTGRVMGKWRVPIWECHYYIT